MSFLLRKALAGGICRSNPMVLEGRAKSLMKL
jgi:hypothetical protein